MFVRLLLQPSQNIADHHSFVQQPPIEKSYQKQEPWDARTSTVSRILEIGWC